MSETPADRLLADVVMHELPALSKAKREVGIPWATHRGTFTIGEISLTVYQLSDGRRILDADDVARVFAS